LVRRVLYVLVAAAALALVAGCGGKKSAQTFTVDVDGHNGNANEAFIAYFPNTVTVHPGDTVVFDNKGNGEPHTATLGTLVDPVVSAFDKFTPAQLQSQQGPPKAFQALDAKVPQLLPQGPGDAVQASANPCVIASGAPPQKTACPAQNPQPDFDGTQSFYNSGWLDSKAKFTVKLSKSTAPGTYHFMCLLHREGMTGKIVVVPSSTSVASPSDQYASGQKQLAADESKLVPAVTAERQGKAPFPVTLPGDHVVLAGSGAQNVQDAEITEFGPKKISIPVGGTVTWYIVGPHSITFNSDKSNDDIRSVAPDGTVHLNPKAIAPANAPGEPPPSNSGPANGSSNGPPSFKVVADKTWDGSGFLNTGVFVNSMGPPVIEGYTITFTKAGTYKYLCTVHDDMTGEADVG